MVNCELVMWPGISSGTCLGEVQKVKRRKFCGKASIPYRKCMKVAPKRIAKLASNTPAGIEKSLANILGADDPL